MNIHEAVSIFGAVVLAFTGLIFSFSGFIIVASSEGGETLGSFIGRIFLGVSIIMAGLLCVLLGVTEIFQ